MKRSVYISLIMTGLLIAVPAAAQTSLLPGSVSCSGSLGQCIQTLYRFGVGATAILAVIVMMWGGFVWLTSGGNVSRIETAKEWIYGSVLGLVLALTSFLLLNTINPQLTTISISGSATPISGNAQGQDQNTKICCKLTGQNIKTQIVNASKLLAGEDCSGFTIPDPNDPSNPKQKGEPASCPSPHSAKEHEFCATHTDCEAICIPSGGDYLALLCISNTCTKILSNPFDITYGNGIKQQCNL